MNAQTPPTLQELLTTVETIARLQHDGHVTIMRFTTGWKAVYGTPVTMDADRRPIFDLTTKATVELAISDLLNR
jgi:hypothetical protein